MAIISFFEVAAIAMALDQELEGEVNAAISMALHQYMDESSHDVESGTVTIRRKPRQYGPLQSSARPLRKSK